jgi:hypothetical protein
MRACDCVRGETGLETLALATMHTPPGVSVWPRIERTSPQVSTGYGPEQRNEYVPTPPACGPTIRSKWLVN